MENQDPKSNTVRIFRNISALLSVGTFNLNGEQAKALTEAQNFVAAMLHDMDPPAETAPVSEATDGQAEV